MLKKFLFYNKNKEKAVYLWNICSSMLNAFQTVVILMIISRIDPVIDAGVFTIAFAIGNLMLTIGNYGIRQFQVSDVQEKYHFKDYLMTRIITCIVMIAVSIAYTVYYYKAGLYSFEKSCVIILVCLAKAVDAMEDVFLGLYQHKERLDISGRIMTVRLISYIGTYIICYLITQNLIIASAVALFVSVIFFVILNTCVYNDFSQANFKDALTYDVKLSNSKSLLRECAPLFVSAYLVMYVSNAPKYAIDKVLSSQEQACFTYIFMPVFVIGLLSQFVYQPIIGKLSLMWTKGKLDCLKKEMLKQIIVIILLSAAAILGGYLLGIPILSLLYGVNLNKYRIPLVVLLFGGTSLAFIYFFQMFLTIVRCQKYFVWAYVGAYAVCVVLGTHVVEKYGILGISFFYTMIMTGIMLFFAGISFLMLKRQEEKLFI